MSVSGQHIGLVRHLNGFIGVHPVAEIWLVSVNLHRIEVAHERQELPAEQLPCCEHLVNVRVSVNGRGHDGNLMGVQSGDCNGSNWSAAADFVMQG